MANVFVFKLVSGEEIVGDLAPQAINSTKLRIVSPLLMQQYPDGTAGFGDFMTAASPEVIEIDEQHVMISHPATKEAASQYVQLMNEINKTNGANELILPEQKIIVD